MPFVRLITTVPVFALFTEIDDGTLLQVVLIIKIPENLAKIAVKLARPMLVYRFVEPRGAQSKKIQIKIPMIQSFNSQKT